MFVHFYMIDIVHVQHQTVEKTSMSVTMVTV